MVPQDVNCETGRTVTFKIFMQNKPNIPALRTPVC